MSMKVPGNEIMKYFIRYNIRLFRNEGIKNLADLKFNTPKKQGFSWGMLKIILILPYINEDLL
jgi:hypothetical protein